MVPGSLSTSKLLLNFFLHMQVCSLVALSLHRISSVVCYKSYEKVIVITLSNFLISNLSQIWSRFHLLYALLSILYSTLPLLWIHKYAAEVSLINGTLSVTYHLDVMSKLLLLNAICSIVYFLGILALGLTTAFLVSKIIRGWSPLSVSLISYHFSGFNNVDYGLSRKLTRITLIYCSLYTGILLWSIVRSIDSYFPFLPALFTTYKLDILVFSSDAVWTSESKNSESR